MHPLTNKQFQWLIQWRDFFEMHPSEHYTVPLLDLEHSIYGESKILGQEMYLYLKDIIEQGKYKESDKKWLNALKHFPIEYINYKSQTK